VQAVGVFLNGEAITDRDRRGQRITDDSFLLLFNAQEGPIDWTLPKQWGKRWETSLDTSEPEREGDPFDSGAIVSVGGRSLIVLQRLGEPSD
jgi:isoamylase